MDIKSCLLLCKPINFKNICKIYPIDLDTYLDDEEKINDLYLPYAISKEYLSENPCDCSNFEIVLSNQEYFTLLYESLLLLCKTSDIKIKIDDPNNPELFFDDNKSSLNKNNFDEFADIVLLSGGKERYKPEVIPVFETPEGYERWKKYEENKKKYTKKEDSSLANLINVVQSGGFSYVSEELIKKWSVWKLINSYNSTINRDGYDKQYSQYLVTGKPDNIKEHWSELLKVK